MEILTSSHALPLGKEQPNVMLAELAKLGLLGLQVNSIGITVLTITDL